LSLVATLLGEGHSKMKPRVDNALEAVVKASRTRFVQKKTELLL